MSAESAEHIDRRFSSNPAATAGQQSQLASIREAVRSLAHFLDDALPAGRHKALALTHLEDVMFRATAAVEQAGGAPVGPVAPPGLTYTDSFDRSTLWPAWSGGQPRPGQTLSIAEAQQIMKQHGMGGE